MNDNPTWEQIQDQLKQKIIAIDFDETITEYAPYPIQGKLKKDADKYIRKLHEKGYRLVLWSARFDSNYDLAFNMCKDWNLPIEKDSSDLLHGKSGKLVASFYIDDKSIPGKLDWKKMYNYIVKNI